MAIRPSVVWRDGEEGGTPLSAANLNTMVPDAGRYTDEQVAAIPSDAAAGTASLRRLGTSSTTAAAGNRGLPTGGTTGQVLAKLTSTNYEVGWVTPSGRVPTPLEGNVGQVLTVVDAAEDGYQPAWRAIPAGAASSTASMRRLGTRTGEAAPGSNAVGCVHHGTAASFPRPFGYAMVIWIGMVRPEMMAAVDLWVEPEA